MQKLQKPDKTYKYLIGIDEVGRGPVAGPVAVCASIINFGNTRKSSKQIKNTFKSKEIKLPILRDSKKLTEAGRNNWFEFLTKGIENRLTFSLSYSSAAEIDKKGIAVCIRTLISKNLNILQEQIGFDPKETLILLDGGLKAPEEYINQETIIKGDDKEPIISFASIFAKVSRDKLMVKFSKKYPEYGLEIHKGYGTKKHMLAIRIHGLSNLHRKSFLKSI